MEQPQPPHIAAQELVAFLGAAAAGQIATKADLENAIAPIAVQLAAMQAQLAAMQAGQAQMQVQLAAIQAFLAPHNAPVIAAAASATVLSITASRMRNAHDRSDEVYSVVLRPDGTPPPNWPNGFDRSMLISGPILAIDMLLNDFGLANGPPATLTQRRNALAVYIGTTRV